MAYGDPHMGLKDAPRPIHAPNTIQNTLNNRPHTPNMQTNVHPFPASNTLLCTTNIYPQNADTHQLALLCATSKKYYLDAGALVFYTYLITL